MTVPALPPATGLRVLPAVDPEPPYDDEPARPVLRLVPTPDADPAPPVRPALRLVEPLRDEADGLFAPRPTPRTELPPPAAWAGRFVQAVLEVRAGTRPAGQLVRWTTPAVQGDLERDAAARATLAARRPVRRPSPGRLRSVRVSEPADGVAEVAAVVTSGAGRVRAVALRLEGVDGRWRCTSLSLV